MGKSQVLICGQRATGKSARSMDGEIGWESGTFRMDGRPDSHIIEVLTKNTPVSYRAYLREKGVSYILAGKEQLDCQTALEKLYTLFGIKKVLICGWQN